MGTIHRCAVAAMVISCSNSASAQSLAGRVIDEHSRLPLRSVHITVLADSARVVSSTSTDSIGAFYADLPAAGTYRVRIAVDSTTGFESAPITVRDSAYVEREFAITLEERIYSEQEVTRLPMLLPMTSPPKYPLELRTAEIEGNVVAEFVIDTTGSVRPGTFTVVHATDPRFALSVRKALETARFLPAEMDGVRVAARVHQRFTFGINKVGFEPPPGATTAPKFPKPVIEGSEPNHARTVTRNP